MVLTKAEFVEYAMAHMDRVKSGRKRRTAIVRNWPDITRYCSACGRKCRSATMHQRKDNGKQCHYCSTCWDGRPKRRNG